MKRVLRRVEIKAPPERVWAILGNLTLADKWIPGIVHLMVEGTEKRVCTFADGHVQHEHITDYSNERRSYRYAIEGAPGMKANRGRFAVESNGPRSIVVWESEFEPVDPSQAVQMATMWEQATNMVMESLRSLVEGTLPGPPSSMKG